MDVSSLYFYKVSKFMHSVHQGRNPNAFDNYFQPISHTYSTRNRQLQTFNLLQPRTERGKRSLMYKGVDIWAQVHDNLKNLNTKQFNFQLKEYIISLI